MFQEACEADGRSRSRPPYPVDPLFDRFLRGEAAALARAERLIGAIVGSRHYYIRADERADLKQQVLLELVRDLSRRDFPQTRNFDAYVRTRAKSRCIDWERKQRRRNVIGLELVVSAPEPHRPTHAEQRDLARRLLAELRAPCRLLLHRIFVLGMSHAEVAALQGRTANAVKTQKCVCLKEARQVLSRLAGARTPPTSEARTR